MSSAWTVRAGPRLWIIFDNGIFVYKHQSVFTIQRITPRDLRLTHSEFYRLAPAALMLRFSLRLQEMYYDAHAVQTRALEHLHFLANLVPRLETYQERLLLRRAMIDLI